MMTLTVEMKDILFWCYIYSHICVLAVEQDINWYDETDLTRHPFLPAHVFHIDIVLSRANYEIDLNRAAVGLRISDCFFADNDKTIENEDEIKSDAIIYAQNEINSQL